MNMTSPTGPVNEGSEVSLLCQANGGKPVPDIRWYKIGKLKNLVLPNRAADVFHDQYINKTLCRGVTVMTNELNVSRVITQRSW